MKLFEVLCVCLKIKCGSGFSSAFNMDMHYTTSKQSYARIFLESHIENVESYTSETCGILSQIWRFFTLNPLFKLCSLLILNLVHLYSLVIVI